LLPKLWLDTNLLFFFFFFLFGPLFRFFSPFPFSLLVGCVCAGWVGGE
jgi:hypothetical protein